MDIKVSQTYKPGWIVNSTHAIEAGMGEGRPIQSDVRIVFYQDELNTDNPTATIVLVDAQGTESYCEATADQLRNLIGAMTVILQAMEAWNRNEPDGAA